MTKNLDQAAQAAKAAQARQAIQVEASRHPEPLLKEKHFKKQFTGFTQEGLQMDAQIGRAYRWPIVHSGVFDSNQKRREALEDMPATRIVINPKNWSLQRLNQHFLSAQAAHAPDEGVNIKYEQDIKKYKRQWDCRLVDDGLCEGQQIFMVAFNGKEPVGFLNMELFLARCPDDDVIDIVITNHMVYVSPTERGQARAIDLNIAAGMVVSDVLCAAHRAARISKRFKVTVEADYISSGGESFTNYLYDCAEIALEEFHEDEKRKRKTIGRVSLDAGY